MRRALMLAIVAVIIASVALGFTAQQLSSDKIHKTPSISDHQLLEQQALDFARDIVGLDYSKYSGQPELPSYSSPAAIYYILYYGNSPPHSNWATRIVVYYTNINGTVIQFSISTVNGTLVFLNGDKSLVKQAEGILENYRASYNASYTKDMISLLSTKSIIGNRTESVGNVTMDMTDITSKSTNTRTPNLWTQEQTVTWSRTINGIPNSYDTLSICFDNSTFYTFNDKWNEHEIGSVEVNVNKQQALDIAGDSVKGIELIDDNYVTDAKMVVGSASASLSFEPSNPPSGPLYPTWQVGGRVTAVAEDGSSCQCGVTMMIRADTGEVTDFSIWTPRNFLP